MALHTRLLLRNFIPKCCKKTKCLSYTAFSNLFNQNTTLKASKSNQLINNKNIRKKYLSNSLHCGTSQNGTQNGKQSIVKEDFNENVNIVISGNEASEQWTHFGYEKVREDDKVNKVYDVFENVADSYDLMNDVMSAGTHRLWKHNYVSQMNIKAGMKILDMAGGTGDIAFKMLDKLIQQDAKAYKEQDTEIIISDINQAMLDVGKQRAKRMKIDKEFDWVQANAEELPFEDDTFDLYSIAFGIRNTTHIEKVLDEAYRVLKPGGRFTCLEFSNVQNPIIKSLYDTYSFQMIPVFGSIFANDWQSYQYLVESIRQFPNQEDFSDLIYDAGFSHVMYENMTFGVVAIHDGFKL